MKPHTKDELSTEALAKVSGFYFPFFIQEGLSCYFAYETNVFYIGVSF